MPTRLPITVRKLPESSTYAQDILDASAAGHRLFRNNVGVFLSLDGTRHVRCGLAVGSADLIGWQSCVITQDDIGKRVAIFWSVEKKALKGTMRNRQIAWAETVNASGGIAEVVKE